MSLSIDQPVTYLITEGLVTDEDFGSAGQAQLEKIRFAVDSGISLVQIREKGLSTRMLCKLAAAACEITALSPTKLLINDRADVAVAVGADGVHLTSRSLPANVIRNAFSAALVIGVSVHTEIEAIEAARQGADFAVFAPVSSTPGKGEPTGLTKLSEVCRAVEPFPILALGGIDETNVAATLNAGASGFAAIRSLNDTGSLRSILEKARIN